MNFEQDGVPSEPRDRMGKPYPGAVYIPNPNKLGVAPSVPPGARSVHEINSRLDDCIRRIANITDNIYATSVLVVGEAPNNPTVSGNPPASTLMDRIRILEIRIEDLNGIVARFD